VSGAFVAVLVVLAAVAGVAPTTVAASGSATVSMGSLRVLAPTAAVKVPITLSQPQASDVLVTWAVTSGVLGTDYLAPRGPKTVRIPAGRTRAFASVKLVRYGDTAPLTISIQSVTGAPVGVGVGSGVIDVVAWTDAADSFWTSYGATHGAFVLGGSVHVVEGDGTRPQTVSVPVALGDPNWIYTGGADVDVTWQLTPVTATPGADYKALTAPRTTRIRYAAGHAFLNVPIFGDTEDEPDESFEVTILSASVVLPAPPPPWTCYVCLEDVAVLGSGTVTIVDDDEGAGNLAAWGWTGADGIDGNSDEHTPTAVGTNPDWQDLAAGGGSVLAIDGDGSLWAWGENWWGQLGLGDTDGRATPTQVGTDTDWAAVDVSAMHALALKTDGTLWAWGANGVGQLGTGDTTDQLTPVQIGSDTDWIAVSAGGGFSLALKSDGTLWSWGTNNFGELGQGDTLARWSPDQVGTENDWVAISAAPNSGHGFALKAGGTLWAWGYNEDGQLGLGDFLSPRLAPTQVGTDTDWLGVVVASNGGGFALKSNGTLWAWGANGAGQLGLGDTLSRLTPTQVGSATWIAVAPGGSHTLGLQADGTLWAWGNNFYGQLGLGDTVSRLTPTQVGSATWSAVAAGDGFSLALRS
jgi:alpha-tubulin suppressor-like RCC1 family protein